MCRVRITMFRSVHSMENRQVPSFLRIVWTREPDLFIYLFSGGKREQKSIYVTDEEARKNGKYFYMSN